jgi:hypothetical protein
MDLGMQPTEFFLGGGELAWPWEGNVGPFVARGIAPVSQAVFADAEASRDLGEGESLLVEHAKGLELELAGVALAGHRAFSLKGAYTLNLDSTIWGKASNLRPRIDVY